MKLISLSSILYLFYTMCLATDDIVRFVYNDGFSYNEIEIPLRATKDARDWSIRKGSWNIPMADIYAARILSGPEDVWCVFEAVSKNFRKVDEKGNPRLRKVGRALYKLETVMQYTTPPQDVVQITCSVGDFYYNKGLTELSRERERIGADLSWDPFPHRPSRIIINSLSVEELRDGLTPPHSILSRFFATGAVGEEEGQGGEEDEDDESEDESL